MYKIVDILRNKNLKDGTRSERPCVTHQVTISEAFKNLQKNTKEISFVISVHDNLLIAGYIFYL